MASTMTAGTAATGRVLITDAHWNKAVAAIRTLGRRGLTVFAGESTRLAAGLFSRHVHRRLRYPSPLAEPEAFIAAIEAELKLRDYDVLMPMELNTQMLLSRHRDRLTPLVRFPFAPHHVLSRAAGKQTVIDTARAIGVPAPCSRKLPMGIAPGDLAQDLGLPLVLKPDVGEGGRGLFYCRSEAELEQALEHIARSKRTYVAQEWIPAGGEALGVSMLLNAHHETLARFTHRRLREYPVSGGPSTLRESHRHPEAEQYARQLLVALKWQGVAMVEFKVDPRDQKPKLMEINPRFWGSLPLAIRCGVDFPYLLYRMAMDLPMGPPPEQRTGIKLRNLLPGDLLYFLAKRGKVGLDFFRPQAAGDELLSWRDPGPVIGRLLSPLALLYDPQLRAVLQKRQSPQDGR